MSEKEKPKDRPDNSPVPGASPVPESSPSTPPTPEHPFPSVAETTEWAILHRNIRKQVGEVVTNTDNRQSLSPAEIDEYTTVLSALSTTIEEIITKFEALSMTLMDSKDAGLLQQILGRVTDLLALQGVIDDCQLRIDSFRTPTVKDTLTKPQDDELTEWGNDLDRIQKEVLHLLQEIQAANAAHDVTNYEAFRDQVFEREQACKVIDINCRLMAKDIGRHQRLVSVQELSADVKADIKEANNELKVMEASLVKPPKPAEIKPSGLGSITANVLENRRELHNHRDWINGGWTRATAAEIGDALRLIVLDFYKDDSYSYKPLFEMDILGKPFVEAGVEGVKMESVIKGLKTLALYFEELAQPGSNIEDYKRVGETDAQARQRFAEMADPENPSGLNTLAFRLGVDFHMQSMILEYGYGFHSRNTNLSSVLEFMQGVGRDGKKRVLDGERYNRFFIDAGDAYATPEREAEARKNHKVFTLMVGFNEPTLHKNAVLASSLPDSARPNREPIVYAAYSNNPLSYIVEDAGGTDYANLSVLKRKIVAIEAGKQDHLPTDIYTDNLEHKMAATRNYLLWLLYGNPADANRIEEVMVEGPLKNFADKDNFNAEMYSQKSPHPGSYYARYVSHGSNPKDFTWLSHNEKEWSKEGMVAEYQGYNLWHTTFDAYKADATTMVADEKGRLTMWDTGAIDENGNPIKYPIINDITGGTPIGVDQVCREIHRGPYKAKVTSGSHEGAAGPDVSKPWISSNLDTQTDAYYLPYSKCGMFPNWREMGAEAVKGLTLKQALFLANADTIKKLKIDLFFTYTKGSASQDRDRWSLQVGQAINYTDEVDNGVKGVKLSGLSRPDPTGTDILSPEELNPVRKLQREGHYWASRDFAWSLKTWSEQEFAKFDALEAVFMSPAVNYDIRKLSPLLKGKIRYRFKGKFVEEDIEEKDENLLVELNSFPEGYIGFNDNQVDVVGGSEVVNKSRTARFISSAPLHLRFPPLIPRKPNGEFITPISAFEKALFFRGGKAQPLYTCLKHFVTAIPLIGQFSDDQNADWQDIMVFFNYMSKEAWKRRHPGDYAYQEGIPLNKLSPWQRILAAPRILLGAPPQRHSGVGDWHEDVLMAFMKTAGVDANRAAALRAIFTKLTAFGGK